MGFEKVGFNMDALQNLTPPSWSDFNVSTTSNNFISQVSSRANETVSYAGTSYLGLGIMVTLFFYLVFKLGNFLEIGAKPYGTIRSVGIAGGICGIMGIQMVALGFFTELYHVVIFIGITLVSTLWVYLNGRR